MNAGPGEAHSGGEKRLVAEHGVVCRMAGRPRGYFGWPTVANLGGNRLMAAASGLRAGHVCPWGATVICGSVDGGRTWSEPQVVNDTPLDDRDAGLLSLGDGRVLLSWFTSDHRSLLADPDFAVHLDASEAAAWRERLAGVTDEASRRWLGSRVRLTDDYGESWGEPIRVPVTAPHGPIRLADSRIFYLGKSIELPGAITACVSDDGGKTWEALGQVPLAPRTVVENYHEPHAVELAGGRLIGAIRLEDGGGVNLERDAAIPGGISIAMTESVDGGRTWRIPHPLRFHGSPPHLLCHSSGVLVMSYGYRHSPSGQRVAFSFDQGLTWDHDWIVRDDGPDWDLGYPSTVELASGELVTVCYQKLAGDTQCSLLWSRWNLPAQSLPGLARRA